MKILIISLAGIGDTLFATPLIHELRANFPQATIDAFVLWPGAKDLLENNPHLNSVYQKNLLKAGALQSFAYLGELRRKGYDFSVSTHPQSKIEYRLVARLINATQRVSHRYDNHSWADHWLVNRTLAQNYDLPCIENNLALLSFLGGKPKLSVHDYEVYLTQAELDWAQAYFSQHSLNGRILLGIHSGSGGTKNLALRRWPVEAYAELINRLTTRNPEIATLIFGGPDEKDQIGSIMSKVARSEAVFHPETKSLRLTAALIKNCSLFLSVDTALMHLAAATKVPGQIIIETPSWNKPIFPYNQRFAVVPNPSLGGKNLSYYRYDGRGIKATADQIQSWMASVTVDSVYDTVVRVARQLRPDQM